MNRRIRDRLEHVEELAGSSGQEDAPEVRARVREHLARLEQARRDGLLSEEDRSELRARINAERAARREARNGHTRGEGVSYGPMCRYQGRWRPVWGQAIRNSQWCFSHHPDYEEERRRRGSKGGKRGGRGRPSPATAELLHLRKRFEDLADEVLGGAVDRGDAAVVAQLLNGARACVVGILKAREQEELEVRLEEVEALLTQRKETRWRA